MHRTKVWGREKGRLPWISSSSRLREGQTDSGVPLGQGDALFYISAELKDQKVVRQTLNSERQTGIEQGFSDFMHILTTWGSCENEVSDSRVGSGSLHF